uniref:CD3 gamma/delta subunit Ig-like domain-containing protein n=1 Tax=Neogobius melanostomus TaxID=47308 RepID=A0A8C6TKH1_9GOBI
MVFLAVLAFTLLIPVTVEAEVKGDVSFLRDNVTLTCPLEGVVEWFKGSKNVTDGATSATFTYKYEERKDHYHCKNQDKTYHFYIQGKVCENCFELDALVFVVIIVADVIGTTVIMIIVYKCSKKTSGGPQKTPNPTRPREDIPLADTYEGLNPHTRSHDVYAGINQVIRTG